MVTKVNSHIQNKPEEYFDNPYFKYEDLIELSNCCVNDLEVLGSGYFGTVYDYKGFAVKVINHIEYTNQKDVFYLKKLKGFPCIPDIYGVVNDKIFVMEKINGMTLYDYLGTQNTYGVTKESVNRLLEQYDEIWKSGSKVLDMHNENIMVREDGEIMIVDVGNFKVLHDFEEEKKDGYAYISNREYIEETFKYYFKTLKKMKNQ